MCFANSLSPQSWLNIHPSIEDRIYELNPTILQELQLENLKKLRNRPLFSLFRSLEEMDECSYTVGITTAITIIAFIAH
jgi:hypothetical protein